MRSVAEYLGVATQIVLGGGYSTPTSAEICGLILLEHHTKISRQSAFFMHAHLSTLGIAALVMCLLITHVTLPVRAQNSYQATRWLPGSTKHLTCGVNLVLVLLVCYSLINVLRNRSLAILIVAAIALAYVGLIYSTDRVIRKNRKLFA